jgi:hypothetical protein
MIDFMLRAATQDAMEDALIAAALAEEVVDPEGEVAVQAVECVIDHIGPIAAQVDDEGIILHPGDSRWHTNIRVFGTLTQTQINALPTFTPTPSIPHRVFA